MTEFTPQDIFWILFTIAAIFAIVGFIFRSILKIALTAAVIMALASFGFGILPEQMDKWQNGEITSNEIVGEIGGAVANTIEGNKDVIEEEVQSWTDQFIGAWEKVLCSINGSCEEQPNDETLNNEEIKAE